MSLLYVSHNITEQTINDNSITQSYIPEETIPSSPHHQTNTSYESEESFFYIGAGEDGFCPSHSIHDSDISETDDELLEDDDDISLEGDDDEDEEVDNTLDYETEPGVKALNMSILTEYVDENGGVEIERSSLSQRMVLDTSILTEIVDEEEKKDDSLDDVVESYCVDGEAGPSDSLQSDLKAMGAYRHALSNGAYHRSTTVESSSPLSTRHNLDISPNAATPHSPSAGDEFVSSSFKNFLSLQENNLTSLLSSIEGLTATPGRIKDAVQNGMYEEDDLNMDSGLGLTPLKCELANIDWKDGEHRRRGRLFASHEKEGSEHRNGVLFPSPLADTSVLETVGEEAEHRGAVLFQSPPTVEEAAPSASCHLEEEAVESHESRQQDSDLENSMEDAPVRQEEFTLELSTEPDLKQACNNDINIGLPQSPLPQPTTTIQKKQLIESDPSPKPSPLEMAAADFSTRSAELMDYLRQSIEKSPNPAESPAANHDSPALSSTKESTAAGQTQLSQNESSSTSHCSDNAQQIEEEQNDDDEIPASLREMFANAESILQKELSSPFLKASDEIDTDGMDTFCDDYIKPTSNIKLGNSNAHPNSNHLPFASPTDCIPIDTANLNKTNSMEGETTDINLESLKEVFLKAESQLESAAASPINRGHSDTVDDLNDQNSAADTTFDTANFSMGELAAAVDDFFDAQEEHVDPVQDDDNSSESKLVVDKMVSIRDASLPDEKDYAGVDQNDALQNQDENSDSKPALDVVESIECASQSNAENLAGPNQHSPCADEDSTETNRSPESDSNVDITQTLDRVGEYLKRMTMQEPELKDDGNDVVPPVSDLESNEMPESEVPAESDGHVLIRKGVDDHTPEEGEMLSLVDGLESNEMSEPDGTVESERTDSDKKEVAQPAAKEDDNAPIVHGLESDQEPPEVPTKSEENVVDLNEVNKSGTKGDDILSPVDSLESNESLAPKGTHELEENDPVQKGVSEITARRGDHLSPVNDLVSNEMSDSEGAVKSDGNKLSFEIDMSISSVDKSLTIEEKPVTAKKNSLPSHSTRTFTSDTTAKCLADDPNSLVNSDNMADTPPLESSTRSDEMNESMFIPNNSMEIVANASPAPVVPVEPTSESSDDNSDEDFFPNRNLATKKTTSKFVSSTRSKENIAHSSTKTSSITSRLRSSSVGRNVNEKTSFASGASRRSVPSMRKVSSRNNTTQPKTGKKTTIPASTLSRRARQNIRTPPKSPPSNVKPAKKRTKLSTITNTADSPKRVGATLKYKAKVLESASVHSRSSNLNGKMASAPRAASTSRSRLPTKTKTNSESRLVGVSPRSSSIRRSLIVVAKSQRDLTISRPKSSQQQSNLHRSERLAQLAKPRSVVKKQTTPAKKTSSTTKKSAATKPPSFLNREPKRSLMRSTEEMEVEKLSSAKPFKASKIRGSNATVKSRYNATPEQANAMPFKSLREEIDNYNFRQTPAAVATPVDPKKFSIPSFLGREASSKAPKHTVATLGESITKYNFRATPTAKTPINSKARPPSFLSRPSPSISHSLPKSSEELELEECKNKFKACPLPVSSVSRSRPASRPREGRCLTTPRPPKLHTSARPGMKTPVLTQDEIELKKQFHARPLPVSLYGSSFATSTPARYYGKTPQPDADEVELNKKFHALPLPAEIYGRTVDNSGTPFHIRSEQQYQSAMERKKQMIEDEIEQLKMCRERKATPLPPTNREAKPIIIKKSNKELVQPRPPRLSLDARSLERKQFDDIAKQIRDEETAAETARIEAEVRAQEEEVRRRRSLTIEEGGLCFRARPVSIRYE